MRKQSSFDKIDNYFATKKDSETSLYIFLAFAVLAGIIYFVVSPMSTDYFNAAKSKLETATANLDRVNNELIQTNDNTIKQHEAALAGLKVKHGQYVDANKYVDGKLQEVSTLTYNEKNWAKFLDELTLLAQQNNIKLYELTSEALQLELGKVQEVLNVGLSVEGTYNNVLKYINSIEESEMVVDIYGLDFNSTGRNIAGDINISLWGMKYDEINSELARQVESAK